MNTHTSKKPLVINLENVGINELSLVGGKNANLGEMIRELKGKGIKVPEGFAITSYAYWRLIEDNQLRGFIEETLKNIKLEKIKLSEGARKIRETILKAQIPKDIRHEIIEHYKSLSSISGQDEVAVAVRSSSTFEDLPSASFAGQQESYLNIAGERELLQACLMCFASLFTERAIAYRNFNSIDHMQAALSIGVQRMARSDWACAGVAFTLDTESGFPKVVLINGSWGLGESVVKGLVSPDEFLVFKPFLAHPELSPLIGKELGSKSTKLVYASNAEVNSDIQASSSASVKEVSVDPKKRNEFVLSEDEIYSLSRKAIIIEEHYGRPMDIEWAKDGVTGEIYIVQARPETTHSRKKNNMFFTSQLKSKGVELARGLSVGSSISSGTVKKVASVNELERIEKGDILLAKTTSPDWGSAMKRAGAVITDEGGRTCHAAIVGRELGIPVVVGTGNGFETLKDGEEVTVSCAEGSIGKIYRGALEFSQKEIDLSHLPKTHTKVMINAADPSSVFNWWKLPISGIGLARLEFIINNDIKIHPMALIGYPKLSSEKAKSLIEKMTSNYHDKKAYFVERLALAFGKMAASQWPNPVTIRFSDFKSNEYAKLIGGEEFEKPEHNPMLGFRGASRYYDPRYKEAFGLECAAIKFAREKMGFANIIPMIPFCRTLDEADRVLEVMSQNGLKRGELGLKVYVMAEIPSNIILADGFAQRFDGFSIGSNDLTQLVLGVDRDSSDLSQLFDEKNEAIKRMIHLLIQSAREHQLPVGICGEAPSNYPEFSEFLIRQGIDSISLSPDRVVDLIKVIGLEESRFSEGEIHSHPQ